MTDRFERFEKFSFSISAIYRYIQKIEADEMEKYGLKGAFAQYLAVMLRYPEGITAARLCEICDKNKAAVSRTVAEMEQMGLLIRKGTEEHNYRAPLILTEKGKKAADYVREKAKTAVEIAGDGLSGQERKSFYAALDLIAAKLQKISKEGISLK